MARYGQIREHEGTAQEFRVNLFFQSTIEQQLGNGGIPKTLQDFLKANRELVEDVFSDDDSVYILPKTKEFAGELFNVCTGPYGKEFEEYAENCADEIDWNKIEGRYWLGLWWD
jgi:hypothetical protein